MVGFELEVLSKKVDRFGWDRDRGTPAHDRLMTDWMLALQDYPLDEIQEACRAAVASNPNKMPNEGHVLAEVMKIRARKVVPQKQTLEVKEARITAEAAKAIMDERGFRPKKMTDNS